MIIGGRQSGLGRGLGALIPPKPQAVPPAPAVSSAFSNTGVVADSSVVHQILLIALIRIRINLVRILIMRSLKILLNLLKRMG